MEVIERLNGIKKEFAPDMKIVLDIDYYGVTRTVYENKEGFLSFGPFRNLIKSLMLDIDIERDLNMDFEVQERKLNGKI